MGAAEQRHRGTQSGSQLMRDVQRMLEDTLEDADASPQSRLNLLVELASAEGAQIFELSEYGDETRGSSQVLTLMTDVTRRHCGPAP